MFASDGLTVEELTLDDWCDTVGGIAAPVPPPQGQPGCATALGVPVEAAVDEWLRAAFAAERQLGRRASAPARPPLTSRGGASGAGLAGARSIYWLWLAGAALALWLQAA